MNINEIDKILKDKLDKKRYEHTIGVMYTCGSLCMCYGLDVERGMLAGLLHDCAKAYKSKKQFELCHKYGVMLTPMEEENHALIHAKLGAYIAEHTYKIEDFEILNAIRCHTTGKPNMTVLEMILYISDYIEPYRELPHLNELRKQAFNNLELTMCNLLELSIEHLKKDERAIDSLTMKSYEYFLDLYDNK